MWRGDFLASDEGQRLISRRRWYRRLRIRVNSIEPRSKAAMAPDQCRGFQEQVHSQMANLRRRAYRGPIVLRLGFTTTERNPSHIHTLAKNFLDLLGPSQSGPAGRRGLLYQDDGQVHGLTVRCEHGGKTPQISIEGRSLGDFREDLAVAMAVGSGDDDSASDTLDDDPSYPSALDHWERDEFVRIFGEAAWQAQIVRFQQGVQRGLLRYPRLRIHDLAYLYRSLDTRFGLDRSVSDTLSGRREEHIVSSPFRITLRELPQHPGASAEYRAHVVQQLQAFRSRFKKLLSPIRIPIGLEVVVKPPPYSRLIAAHDLDNILRRYLVPGVVETFEPPSHYHWANDAAYPGGSSQDKRDQPPRSTATGLIRLEAWRIPRASNDLSPGFVSLALVADEFGYGGSLRAIDGVVDTWLEGD
jgi:hypothetical protein